MIEVEFEVRGFLIAVLLILLLTLGGLGLGILGRSLAPDRLLTWDEWLILKQKKAYRHELEALQRQAEVLAGLLENQPDAVRGQWVYEETAELVASQHVTALQKERAALLRAAQVVRDWSMGQASWESAHDALEQAVRELQK